jgi:hypothetical protein
MAACNTMLSPSVGQKEMILLQIKRTIYIISSLQWSQMNIEGARTWTSGAHKQRMAYIHT